jgi:hypothetical protein
MKMWALVVLTVLFAVAVFLTMRPGANLAGEYGSLRRAMAVSVRGSGKVLNAEDMSHLPEPVQNYLRATGAVGQPVVTSVHTIFETELFSAPGSPAMRGVAHQVDALDPPRRLFFMETWMSGLPVAVLHRYEGDAATMRVRMARLFDVVNASGVELSRTETVTLLNDICAFMPSALIRPEFKWRAINDNEAGVIFSNGPHTVHATLFFDGAGHLTDFRSEDRGDLQKDGSLRIMPWTTPLGDYRYFDGRAVPGHGEAIWHRPDGPFTYGRFKVSNVRFNKI